MTEGPGHARILSQTFVDQGYDTVIAMGGDGTVNEVAQALSLIHISEPTRPY